MTDLVTLDAIEASIAEALAASLAPLREQLAQVEARERLIAADLEATRAVKTRLVKALRKLDPAMPGPGRKVVAAGKNGNAKRDADTVEAAKRAIDQISKDNPEGFTRTRVHTQMKINGMAIGDKRVQAAIDQLHDSGYLTLHKIVVGGNKAYKRTEDLNGSPRQAV